MIGDVIDELTCRCGTVCKRIIESERRPHQDGRSDWDNGWRVESKVVESDCPHGTNTTTEHCPSCGRQVGAHGFGVVGEGDCPCWDRPMKRRIRAAADWCKAHPIANQLINFALFATSFLAMTWWLS
ncbi:hypothetical protein FK530_22995 [Tsukamurella conjunctivitidis]|uniref:Uncharacterized protein n=1 Tax=Tsukamurella conjunctivitidis TaxID=2592068 RepID=A0A5C5RRA2_9ACTN|nr:hypothetical protein [Tsukamurella conjunctivitidis]TWS25589.1 hypothetical protein FK530_22995 [Tsukamurella conjunctivitidis]